MADDIVKQLNELAPTLERGEGKSTVYGAVNEIELLRAENKKLAESLNMATRFLDAMRFLTEEEFNNRG